MVITLIRTGGFTGIPLKKTIDTHTLDPQKSKEIEEMVTSSQFFSVAEGQEKSNQPDRFTYTISIQHEAVSRSLVLHESSLSLDLKRLITSLEQLS